MIRLSSIAQNVSLVLLLLSAVHAQNDSQDGPDKTLSPYFFVRSEQSEVDQLPLKHTESEVNIAGIIADVKVMQIYENQGQSVLEAIYIFPASTRAAVYAMKMTIGERTIEAKIDKRETARQAYEQAIQEGRTASLLEQQRPNVFQMNVGNILPGDKITVELYYTEILTAEKNLYEFIYPTVVGPRYSNQSESAAGERDKWVKNPYLHEGEKAPYTFDINLTLSGGIPISEIFSPTHQLDISYQSKDRAKISLMGGSDTEGNRDFILKYRLTQAQIESGLILQRGEKENFFLLMLQPPARVTIDQVPGREYIFIVDVSGSMHGFPLDISKQLLRDLIGNLRPTDRFNVLLFASASNLLAQKSLPANRTNIEKAIRMIDEENGGGGTELLPALKRALALKRHEDFSRSVIIVTDGYVNVEKEAFELIRKNLGRANFFSFGIGSSVNRFIIEGMARAGMGESFVITQVSEAGEKATKFREYISTPVLTHISYTIDGFDAYDIEPVSIPDVLSERPVILFGKWRGIPDGEFKFRGKTGSNKSFAAKIKVAESLMDDKHAALKYLWARQRLAMLSDYNQVDEDEKLVERITQIGLHYNLLTAYTSFVSIDSESRSDGTKITTVNQPLPLPQGVSNMALAGYGRGSVGSLGPKKYRLSPASASSQVDAAQAESYEVEKQELLTLTEINAGRDDLAEELSTYIESVRNKLESCYQTAIPDGRQGIVKIEMSLEPSGRIKSLTVIQNDFKIKDLADCFKAIMSQWLFKSINITDNTKLKFSLVLGN